MAYKNTINTREPVLNARRDQAHELAGGVEKFASTAGQALEDMRIPFAAGQSGP